VRSRIVHSALVTLRVVATVVVVGGIWQLLYAAGALQHSAFPSATSTLSALADLIGQSGFWSELEFTLGAWAWGLAMGAAVGIVIGLLIGLSRFAYRSLNVTVEFLKTIPVIAALPLAILLFGTQMKMNAVLVALGVTWPILIQAVYGARSVSPVVRDTATVYRMGRLDRLVHTVLPTAAPSIATGVRLAASLALLLVVVAELIGGGNGLGYGIFTAENNADLPHMYAIVIVVGVVGVLITVLFTRVERHLLHWHESQRVEAL
jgi:ABC-type nitrate/sulfonate/bicarbonate transport system permease component